MTYTTPSTVMLVSAMLVATITRRQFGGPGANTRAYSRQKLECLVRVWKFSYPEHSENLQNCAQSRCGTKTARRLKRRVPRPVAFLTGIIQAYVIPSVPATLLV